jgi:hypothetical protein
MTITGSMTRLWRWVADVMRERASNLTITAAILLVLFGIPNAFGYAQFWWSAYKWGSPHVTGFLGTALGRAILIAVALGAIALDQRRITRALHGKKKHDLKTLKGRTLQLRDEMQAFLDSVEPFPATATRAGEDRKDYIRRTWKAVGRRVNKVGHGFELRFGDAVLRIHHEFGEMGIRDSKLIEALRAPFKTDDSYKAIIDGLGKLVARLDNQTEPVTWGDVDAMSADQLQDRLRNDPQFQNDLDSLPPREVFRRPS